MRRQDIADGMRIKKKKKRLRGLQPKMAAHSCAMAAIALPTQFRPTGDSREKWNFSFTVPWISMCASVCLKVAFSCRKWLHFSNLPTLKSIIREL